MPKLLQVLLSSLFYTCIHRVQNKEEVSGFAIFGNIEDILAIFGTELTKRLNVILKKLSTTHFLRKFYVKKNSVVGPTITLAYHLFTSKLRRHDMR